MGFYDGNGDGQPDLVSLSEGENITGFNITLPIPDVIEEEEVELVQAEASPVSLDADVTEGDQGLDFVDGAPESEVDVAIYLDGVEGLKGAETILEYDPTALTLLGVSVNGANEQNGLRANGGFPLGIVTPIGSSVGWSIVLLAPTDDHPVSGKVLLGVASFRVKESLAGVTEVIASQIVVEAAAGSQTLTPFVSVQVQGEGVSRQVAVSVDKDTIEGNGLDTVTLTAELFDLDGIAFSDDNESQVTFLVGSGPGVIDDLSAATVTVSNGVATAVLTASDGGTIDVLVSGRRCEHGLPVHRGGRPTGSRGRFSRTDRSRCRCDNRRSVAGSDG